MKKFLLSAGALLLAVGMGLSWLGLRLGGETTATVNLFGSSWIVRAPFTAGNRGPVVWHSAERVVSVESVPTPMPPSQALVPGSATYTEAEAPINSILVDVDLGQVTIAAGDGYGVSIDSWGPGYQVNQGNYSGELVIESSGGSAALPAKYGSNITIFVPRGAVLDYLHVELDVGDVNLSGLTVQDAYLDLDVGSVVGEGLTVLGTLDVDADVGSVTLFGNLGESVNICADLGDVTLGLADPASDYYWSFTTGLGSITVDGRKQGSGNVNITGGRGNNWLSVEADLGSITVDFGLDFSGDRPPAVAQQVETTFITEGKGEYSTATDDGILTEAE